MNLDLKKIHFKRSKAISGKSVMSPEKDWRALVVSVLVSLALLLALHYYLFYKLSSGVDVGTTASTTESISVDQLQFTGTVERIRNETGEFETLSDRPTVVPDPSR